VNIAFGSAIETVLPPSAACTTTLQGSMSPICGSACSALCASTGLQAPRIT
jgi:hypothetical protein